MYLSGSSGAYTLNTRYRDTDNAWKDGGSIESISSTIAAGNVQISNGFVWSDVGSNSIEASTIKKIFNLRLQGLGAKSIALQLNHSEISNRGKKWNKLTILGLLRNQACIGNTVFGRKDRMTGRVRPEAEWSIVPSHEPIITMDVWQSVQKVIEKDAPCVGKGSPHSHWKFTGMLQCSQCGSSLQIESAKGSSKRYYYYNCRKAQSSGQCPNRRIPAPALDYWLVEVICQKIFTPVEYNPDLLMKRDVVRSKDVWLPETSLLGTIYSILALPMQLHRTFAQGGLVCSF